MMTLLEIIPVELKHAASTNGGELMGPCPWCGGEDRFRVWPEEGESGAFWCRQCDRKGDGIQFVRDWQGASYADARAALGLLPDSSYQHPKPMYQKRKSRKKPRLLSPPPAAWQERARLIAEACAAYLWEPEGERALDWLRGRGLLKRDVAVFRDNKTGAFSGEIYLHDTKTSTRSRTVPLTDRLCRELLALAQGKEADEPVFSLQYMDLDYPWKQVRKAAGLEHLRFKDLRAQVAIYGEEAGVPLTLLSRAMGHDQEKMTQRYQQRSSLLKATHLEAIEAAMMNAPKETPPARKVAN